MYEIGLAAFYDIAFSIFLTRLRVRGDDDCCHLPITTDQRIEPGVITPFTTTPR
ncbi:hypothetical protein ABIE13_000612 [Ottowia thiooxydans]|uniref:Uncharacterized protein n=1 Tax=Ottowia thiooxydans TaxID=219182 RepID=A0ABV2Q3B7_9BURK